MRILIKPPLCSRDADGRKQFRRPLSRRSPVKPHMEFDHFGDLGADCHQRIEGCHRVLEDHGDLPAPDPACCTGDIDPGERLSLPENFAARDTARHVDKPHHCLRRHALARAGLADNAERFARRDREGYPAQGLYGAGARIETDMQIVDFEQRHGHAPTLRRARRRFAVSARAKRFSRSSGSVVTLSQLAKRLMDSTVTTIARPGKVTSHHAMNR